MWSWLRKKKKPDNRRQSVGPFSDDPPPADHAENASVGAVVEEMKAKGYQGPFANVCDEIMSITFHGPEVSMDPPWVDKDDNSFQMRVVDCKQFCSDSFLFAMGDEPQSFVDLFDNGQANIDRLPKSLRDPHVESCLLGYPKGAGELLDGLQAMATSMEDLWNIVLIEGYFYFVRSWTGQLRHRAKVDFRDHAMFVTEVATNSPSAGSMPFADALANDNTFGVRQVDFLIKTLLFNAPSPAPLPNNAPTEAGGIALYALTEYGKIGWYPTFDDTTEYRLCLNGVRGRFMANPDNLPLLNAITALTEMDEPKHRQSLRDELRSRSLQIAFTVPDEDLEKGAINQDTAIRFTLQEWEGHPCIFAYTDSAYRVDSSHGCISVAGKGLADFVRKTSENASVVINPGGPATWRLDATELSDLADEA